MSPKTPLIVSLVGCWERKYDETKAFELVSDALQYEIIKSAFIEQCTFLKEQRKDEL